MAVLKKSEARAEVSSASVRDHRSKPVLYGHDEVHGSTRPSPARDLQENLIAAFDGSLDGSNVFEALNEPTEKKIALKWTVLGSVLICGAFWITVARLVF